MNGALTPVPGPLPPMVFVQTLLRSYLIQGSWNYKTMIGSGFAFAMLPGLRHIFGTESEAVDAAVERHMEHFNAHPYLTGVALGAALRLEANGADAETIRRFKLAVRAPLGSLGDALVWATWLPGVASAALALYWFGAPGWAVAAFFLVVYNVGHVGLRVWGLRVGLRSGREVGKALGAADLGGWTARLQPVVVVLLGVLSGSVLGGGGGFVDAGVFWTASGVAAFVAGLIRGHRAWRPAAVGMVVSVALIAGWGLLT